MCVEASATSASVDNPCSKNTNPSWLSGMLLVRSQNCESICKNINKPVAITVITTTVTAQCMPFCSKEYLPGRRVESNGSAKSRGPNIIDLKSCQKRERTMCTRVMKLNNKPAIQCQFNQAKRRPTIGATPVSIRAKIDSAITQWNQRSMASWRTTRLPSPEGLSIFLLASTAITIAWAARSTSTATATTQSRSHETPSMTSSPQTSRL